MRANNANMHYYAYEHWVEFAVAQLDKAVSYKPGGRGYKSPWCHTSGRTMVLPLRRMNTRNISSVVKAASASGWEPYHIHAPNASKSGSLKILEPSGLIVVLYGYSFTFTHVGLEVLFKKGNLRYACCKIGERGNSLRYVCPSFFPFVCLSRLTLGGISC